MKKIILISLILLAFKGFSQSKLYLRGDSIYLQRDGGNSELIIQNSTRTTKGFLYGDGLGRTSFRHGAIKIDNSHYIVGSDTIHIIMTDSSSYHFVTWIAYGATDSAILLHRPNGSADTLVYTPHGPLKWAIVGNSGTDPGIHYFGSSDNVGISFRTNNLLRLHIDTAYNSTFYGKIRIYNNDYDFIDLRRNSPNDLSVLKIYAQGDFSKIKFETQGTSWIDYSRDNGLGLNTDGFTHLGDNGGSAGSVQTIIRAPYIYDGTNNPTMQFWSPNGSGANSMRGMIASINPNNDVNSPTYRGGDLAFFVNHGGDLYTNTREVMRVTASGNLAVGTTIDDTSAILSLASTTKGFLPPRMTKAQRATINTRVYAGTLTGGTGYTPGSYTVAAVGGTGTGATFLLGVDGSTGVASASVVNSGTGYTVSDVLTFPSLTPGAGATYTITSLTGLSEGMVIYQTDNTPGIRVYNGTNWMKYTETTD